jgi:uncharacterized protein YggE
MKDMNKTLLQVIGTLVAIFLVLAVLDKGTNLARTLDSHKPDNTMSMSAEGRVTAKPDLATVTVGVLTNAKTAKLAQDDNNKNINQVTEAVKKLGIKDEDITTSNFSVYPNYTYTNGKSVIDGYQANQTLTVKVHGIDQSTETLNKVLDAAIASGSNQLQGVNFGFNDPDNLRQQARTQALDKAKQKAQELASQAGLKLGKVISISESGSGYYPPMPYATDSKMGMGGAVANESMAAVQPGSQDITATMTVIFEVK